MLNSREQETLEAVTQPSLELIRGPAAVANQEPVRRWIRERGIRICSLFERESVSKRAILDQHVDVDTLTLRSPPRIATLKIGRVWV